MTSAGSLEALDAMGVEAMVMVLVGVRRDGGYRSGGGGGGAGGWLL